jgi:transcriptional regulator with XRE-family HTH domain
MRKSVFTPEYGRLREELRASREAAGLTQRQLAKRLRFPHSWVAKVENGERRIDVIECGWFLAACGSDALDVLARVLEQAAKVRTRAARRGR